jgi:hypothetical protein
MAVQWSLQVPAEQGARQSYGLRGERLRARRGTTPGEIRRAVDAPARALELVGVLGKVPAGEATLTLRAPLAQRNESSLQRTYSGLLRFPGGLGASQRVEIDVLTYGPSLGAVAIRSAEPLGRRVSLTRYVAAVEAALASIERLLPWQAATSAAETAVLAQAAELIHQAEAALAEESSDSPEGERAA